MNQILYSYFFIIIFLYHLLASRPAGVLLLLVHSGGVPVSGPPSDLLKSWGGGGCDGHVHSTWAGVVDWATVYCIVIVDVDTRAIHRSCLRHRSIYNTFGGKAVC